MSVRISGMPMARFRVHQPLVLTQVAEGRQPASGGGARARPHAAGDAHGARVEARYMLGRPAVHARWPTPERRGHTGGRGRCARRGCGGGSRDAPRRPAADQRRLG